MILDDFKLDGQVALVTGGTKGIGQGLARGLAQAGADLALVSRTPNPGFAREIEGMGRRCRHFAADLTVREETKKVVPAVVEEMGGLDILVNNAGLNHRAAITEFPEEEWNRVTEIQLNANFFLSQAAARVMVPQGRGKIISVASVMSYQGGIDIPAYAAAKHAVAGLTKSLANSLASKGVNVNAIAPGYIETDMTAPLMADPERNGPIMTRTPVGRWGDPGDLAGAVVFLASRASDFVHGSILTVDGGWMAW